MTIGVDPVVVAVGAYAVRWLGVLSVAAVVVATWLAARGASRAGVATGRVLDTAALAIPVGILGARLVRVLSGWDYYFTRPAALWQLDPSGLSVWGGLVAGGLAAAWALRGRPFERLVVADAAAVAAPVGIAIGRLGAFLDGSGQGTPSGLPWATQYTNPLASTPDFGVARHPAQACDALAVLLVLAVLLALRGRHAPGLRCWTFLALYGAARVALSPVQLDPPFLFGLQADALLALAAVGFALVQAARGVWRRTSRREGGRSAV